MVGCRRRRWPRGRSSRAVSIHWIRLNSFGSTMSSGTWPGCGSTYAGLQRRVTARCGPIADPLRTGCGYDRFRFGLRTAARALASKVIARSICAFGCAVGWAAVARSWPCGRRQLSRHERRSVAPIRQLSRHERRSVAPIRSRRVGGRWRRRQPRGCPKRDARPTRGGAQRAVGLIKRVVTTEFQRRVNVRSARPRQERAHQLRWRRQRSRRSRCPPAASRSPRRPPSGRSGGSGASPRRVARQGRCRGVS